MPKRSKKAPDVDWDRIEHMQANLPSGKSKDSKGGNFRVSPKAFSEGMDKVKSSACDVEYCKYWVDKRIRLNCNKYERMCDVVNCELREV